MTGACRKLGKKLREERNRFILKKKAEGLTVAQIAAQTNLGHAQVQRVIREAKKKGVERARVISDV